MMLDALSLETLMIQGEVSLYLWGNFHSSYHTNCYFHLLFSLQFICKLQTMDADHIFFASSVCVDLLSVFTQTDTNILEGAPLYQLKRNFFALLIHDTGV